MKIPFVLYLWVTLNGHVVREPQMEPEGFDTQRHCEQRLAAILWGHKRGLVRQDMAPKGYVIHGECHGPEP